LNSHGTPPSAPCLFLMRERPQVFGLVECIARVLERPPPV
jgi:hypothetical protein